MELIFTQRSINIPVLVGQITQKKRTILNEILNNNVSFDGVTEQQNFLCFYSSSNGEQFVIFPDKITYNKLGKGDLDIKRIKELFSKIFDKLLLDDNVNGLFDFQAISDATNSHVDTIKVFNEKFDGILSQDEVTGVGYRFLINNEKEQYAGEFKIEPLVRDPSKNFYQYIINFGSTVYTKEAFIDLFERFNNDMTTKYNNLIERLSS